MYDFNGPRELQRRPPRAAPGADGEQHELAAHQLARRTETVTYRPADEAVGLLIRRGFIGEALAQRLGHVGECRGLGAPTGAGSRQGLDFRKRSRHASPILSFPNCQTGSACSGPR